MTVPSVADFTSPAFLHQVVAYERATAGEERRFHLLFAYISPRGCVSSGDQVVLACSIGQAAVRIAQERGVSQLFVRKRFYSGKPASEADLINTVFDIA